MSYDPGIDRIRSGLGLLLLVLRIYDKCHDQSIFSFPERTQEGTKGKEKGRKRVALVIR